MVEELGMLCFKTHPDLISIIVLKDTLLNWKDSVGVLRFTGLLVRDWLHADVQMGLMSFLIENSDNLLTLVAGDGLMIDGGADLESNSAENESSK